MNNFRVFQYLSMWILVSWMHRPVKQMIGPAYELVYTLQSIQSIILRSCFETWIVPHSLFITSLDCNTWYVFVIAHCVSVIGVRSRLRLLSSCVLGKELFWYWGVALRNRESQGEHPHLQPSIPTFQPSSGDTRWLRLVTTSVATPVAVEARNLMGSIVWLSFQWVTLICRHH